MTKTVIIVDDSAALVYQLRNFLENELGFQIVAVGSDGMQAVALYRTHRPDFITLDITMPRLNGYEALKKYYAPIIGKLRIDHFEMIDPKVQRRGDVAVLTFNLEDSGAAPDGAAFHTRWNSTEVYALVEGKWKIVHTHWSLTKPELKKPLAQ